MNIDQTLTGFNNYIASQGGLPHVSRYAVEMTLPESMQNRSYWKDKANYNTVLENLNFTARIASLPSKTISTNAVMAAGPEQKYPYADVYDNLSITFLVTKGKEGFALPERTFFEDWMGTVVNESDMLVGFSTGKGAYGVDLFLSGLSDVRGKTSRYIQYKFDRTYPIAISEIKFSSDSHELMWFSVTFSYDRFVRTEKIEDNQPNPKTVLAPDKNKKADDFAEDYNSGISATLIRKDGKVHVREGEFSKPKIMEDFDGGVGMLKMKDGKVTVNEGDFPSNHGETIKPPNRSVAHPYKDIYPKERKPNFEKPKKESEKFGPPSPKDIRIVGSQAPKAPTPKKFTQKLKTRATNLVKEKLGIRPMLDD